MEESDYIKAKRLSIRQTRRILAPYFRARQRQIIPTKENKYFLYYAEKKPTILMSDMTKMLYDGVDVMSVMNETASVLKDTTNSVDPALDEIYQVTPPCCNKDIRISYKISKETNVAAHVAATKEYLKIDDLLQDIRFPDGLGNYDVRVKAVMCVPVLTPENDCLAVFELHRNIDSDVYEDSDLEIVIGMCVWVGATIYLNQERLMLHKQQELNEYLLDVTKCYFADAMLLDKLITEIVNFAKTVLNAEHGIFFVLKPKNDEIYADFYEEGVGKNKDILFKKNIEIKLSPTDTDLVSLVAQTGITINIKNAYDDVRVVQDKRRGYIITSVLCMPIKGYNEILGVLQILNKKTGCFTKSDEVLIQTFTIYCSFILTYARTYEKMKQTNNLNNAYNDMLIRAMQPCIHDYYFVSNHPVISFLPARFHQFDYYISDYHESYMPQLLMYMFNKISEDMFENVTLMSKFILIIRKSYYNNAYHNFHHAFNVCHCMYNMLRKNENIFTPFEMKALMIAAFCHDVGHYGLTNTFLETTKHDLAQLYDASVQEHHHYFVIAFIIKFLKLFQYMSQEEYKAFLEEINTLIVATDLSTHFHRKTIILELLCKDLFSLSNNDHRILFKGLMMTMADLSGFCKPFNIAKRIIDHLYTEFYEEGDKEKEIGLSPMPIMDREKEDIISMDQVEFISVVVIPCALLIARVLPNCAMMYNDALKFQETWLEIQNTPGPKLWIMENSYVDKRSHRSTHSTHTLKL